MTRRAPTRTGGFVRQHGNDGLDDALASHHRSHQEDSMLGLQSNEVSDAIDVLKKDHETVEDLFAQFEDAKESRNDEEMAALVGAICSALTVHAEIEEELFYPVIRKLPEAGDMIDEAAVEHQSIKDLVTQLE